MNQTITTPKRRTSLSRLSTPSSWEKTFLESSSEQHTDNPSNMMEPNNNSEGFSTHRPFRPVPSSLRSIVSTYARPILSILFSNRVFAPKKNKDSFGLIGKIIFVLSSICTFTLFSLLLIFLHNLLFGSIHSHKYSSWGMKDMLFFIISEATITTLLVFIRLLFALDNSDYSNSSETSRLRLVDRGPLGDFFNLFEREILFFCANISAMVITYCTNTLAYCIICEITLVLIGSSLGFVNKSVAGITVVIFNAFCVLLRWVNVRGNDSLELILSITSLVVMFMLWRMRRLRNFKGNFYPSALARNVAFYMAEELLFFFPKILRIIHLISIHMGGSKRNDAFEFFLLAGMALVGSVLAFRVLENYNPSLLFEIQPVKRRPRTHSSHSRRARMENSAAHSSPQFVPYMSHDVMPSINNYNSAAIMY